MTHLFTRLPRAVASTSPLMDLDMTAPCAVRGAAFLVDDSPAPGSLM